MPIDPSYVITRFARSGGAGGQHVNKVATKVELRFQLSAYPHLPDAAKERLRQTYPSQVTEGGEFIVTSELFRSQARNREDALAKLNAAIDQCRKPPKPRHATKPTRGSKKRRLQAKRQRSEIKHLRRERFDG